MIRSTHRRGFTLIEVMAAMAILSVLLLILTKIFNESTRAWSLGHSDSESNIAGRAVMEFVVRDLSQAFADEGVEFRLRSDATTAYGEKSDVVQFVTLGADPDGSDDRRASGLAMYYLSEIKDANGDDTGRYRLMRSYQSDFTTSEMQDLYDPSNDWTSPPKFSRPQPVADNVTAFEMWAYRDPASAATGGSVPNYFSGNFDGNLPAWVDVYLEVLSEKDAVQASLFDPNSQKAKLDAFLDRRAKGYQARVYFRNRAGYLGDR